MKKLLLFLFLSCLFVTKAGAYEWTDESGVKWTFTQQSYTIDNVSRYYWTITGASGNGDEVTIPDMVFVTSSGGLEAYTVEAVSLGLGNSNTVTLPSTLKYLGYLGMNVGVVKLYSSTPPIYGNVSGTVIFKVPAEYLEKYRTAEGWKNVADRIISHDAKTDYTVNTTAKPESSGLQEKIGEDNLTSVMSLKVSGTINSYDILIIRNKMKNLQHLDLTDASIVANTFQYYTGYSTQDNVLGGYAFANLRTLLTVKLPKTITQIGYQAFYNCTGLTRVEGQPGIKSVGEQAFQSCYNLKEATFGNGLETIGSYAFSGCSSLTSIKLPEGLHTINYFAFQSCSNLISIKLPEGLKLIGYGAFRSCRNLETIEFPSTLETLEGYYRTDYDYGVFSGCSKLTSIKLPDRLRTIGNYAFYYTSLTEIHIPSSITSIGDYAFSSNSLKDVYVYTVEPISIAQNTFSTWANATLHVPTFSYSRYYWNTQWNQFSKVVEYEGTYPYDYFYANNDLRFDDDTGIMEGTPDADLNANAGLIVETTKSKLHLGKVTMTETGSIIANNNLIVDNLCLNMNINSYRWYFISLPYRVKLTNITAPGNYVIRYYDGYERASRGGGGWKDYIGSYLQPKQGYIIQCDNYGTLTMLVEKADMDFSGGDRYDALSTYTSSNSQNASWNYLGNPHSSYFDIDDTGYDAPITVWTGSSYQAVRAGDDQYHLAPMQGFFVQKPEGTSNLRFPASGRHTYNQWADRVAAKQSAAARRSAANSQRKIVNLTIGKGETADDQTRVVYNNERTADYELECDAAKFMSDQPVAQLYTIGADGTQYAINERPQGEVNLGYVATGQDELTISAPRMDCPVWLHDGLLNITHDLSLGGYTFTAEAGICNSRFTLLTDDTVTDIVNINSQTATDSHTYTLGGTQTTRNSRGIAIEKSGNKTMKVIKR